MDFYCFYFGQINLLDDLSPFADSSATTFIVTENTVRSIESDDPDTDPSGNTDLHQWVAKPESHIILMGQLEFTEAPKWF